MDNIDVAIVGAGPAGIGMALELGKAYGLEYKILESGQIGESFRRWPSQTRFITPSFFSSPFGLADLNAVDSTSSPAVYTGTEHLSGTQYADYLTSVAHAAQLPIECHCNVLDVTPYSDVGFHLQTTQGEIVSQFLIWATGEYQFPNLNPFPGGEYCLHYAQVQDWRSCEEAAYTVIGGYESGLDAAINLLTACFFDIKYTRNFRTILQSHNPIHFQ